MQPTSLLLSGSVVAIALAASSAFAQPAGFYTQAHATPLGAPDRWDYVVSDAIGGRVYVAHGDRVEVVDAETGALVGRVEGVSGGTHGIGISHATGQGFTDDGRAGEAVVFDLKTLKVTGRIKTDADSDGIVHDGKTDHIFVIEGDPAAVQVIDPTTRTVIATIPGGGKLEYGVADDQGHVYVNGEEKQEIVRIDTRTNKVDAHWPMPGCKSPHGLAMDLANHRLFSGCVNSELIVMNSDTGAVVTTLPIGRGSDAIAFDAAHKRVFSSNGADGTISAFQETTPNSYAALPMIKTLVSGRTMDADSKTGRLFIAAANTDPPATPGGRPKARPGTLRLLMLDPGK